MRTYEELIKARDDRNAKAEAYTKEIATLKAKRTDLERSLPELAETGDADAYQKAKMGIDMTSTAIEVKQSALNALKNPIATVAELNEAWEEFRDRKIKARKALLDGLEAKIWGMYDEYKKITNLSLDILQAKEDLESLGSRRFGLQMKPCGQTLTALSRCFSEMTMTTDRNHFIVAPHSWMGRVNTADSSGSGIASDIREILKSGKRA